MLFAENGEYDFIGRSRENNGVQGKMEKLHFEPNPANTFSLAQVGETVCLFRDKKWYASQNIFILSPIMEELAKQYKFITASINKALYPYRSAYIYPTLPEVKNITIKLPIKCGQIDFEFMENFVAELESRRVAELESRRVAELNNYLLVTGLKDYVLTEQEEKALSIYKDGNIDFKEYKFEDIFEKIKQGRRLKKDDQLAGKIPFVMAGVTNTGIANYISNPIAKFPGNSITIDIFGNTFYRNYAFGAGDDTGVYWSENINYGKECMLYFATTMAKAINGKFSYGKKLRSSQSLKFKMLLPVRKGEIDFEFMKNYISAIQKLVIKDVVLYADSKIKATKSIVAKN